ncbi:DUF397 domain-containing protein [Streptomyces sp. SKN60]|uniref:DUF397 domain-containing protein n=1 Tax=Streptomyces sp. SKN60 TaxID=2855506 RepID=UPI002245B9BB|nr:DUF397 domain-containing protein [Streptomyces sp. SKN60]MCX2181231.1 DUF397 domain-containing protein [Streptomyces sp. SKN60]
MSQQGLTQHGLTRNGPTQHGLTGRDAPDLDLAGADWRSGSRGVGDVQIAFVEGFIAMRNGRTPGGPSVVFSPAEWRAFVVNARDGEFDLT